DADQCRSIEFRPERAFDGSRLLNHKQPDVNGNYKCELNNATHEGRVHELSQNAICHNTKGSHTCACKPGFTGNGHKCEDIDECAEGSYNCSLNAFCDNTEGSYNCDCKPGFTGNGRECERK
ncbi:unnamed protein product, partial [Pocillopora meandrina]